MPSPLPDLTLPVPLALAILLAVVALASFVVRAHGRRQRGRSRRQHRSLTRTFRAFLEGRTTAIRLLRAAERADEAAYWTALESFSLRLKRPQWLRMSRALARARHAAAERRALADDSPWRRVLAARRLALLRSRTSRTALRRAMRRGPDMVTFAAATALARYQDLAALRWLLAHETTLAHRHRNALVALLRGFGRGGMPVIAHALEHGDHKTRVALAIVDTLGLEGHADARPVLEKCLAEGDIDVQAAAARSLGLLQAVECATSLIAALRDDAWQVRAQAARALGRVRAPLATHALAAKLTDPSWWVRHHAAYALKEMGEAGQAALRHVIANSDDPYARDIAQEALTGESARRTA